MSYNNNSQTNKEGDKLDTVRQPFVKCQTLTDMSGGLITKDVTQKFVNMGKLISKFIDWS